MTPTSQIATLAGGCFWCTEAIFRRLKGVTDVVVGYTGGTIPNPTYEQVCSGSTGHAEAVQITFDPAMLPYAKLLEIFFHLHDPTTLNAQGNDIGPQYRSAIFYHDNGQRQEAELVKKELDEAHIYASPIVTQIVPSSQFFEAEQYHKDYYEKNSYAGYCQYVIDPKLAKLIKEHASDVKAEYLHH